MGNIQFTAPSASRYIYEGDRVSFSVSGSNPTWSSSVDEDNINRLVGNNVNGASAPSASARSWPASTTATAVHRQSVTINVLSALAKP